MKSISSLAASIAASLVVGLVSLAGALAQSLEPVTGIVGLTPVRDHTCIAAFVPLSADKALAGVVWYNNDRTTAFPRVLLSSGGDGGPSAISDAAPGAVAVSGVSSGFSELVFAEPIASETGGIYVIFELPAFEEQVGLGDHGGPGIGYRACGAGLAGWLSGDGESWVRMRQDFRLAMTATVVDAQTSMKALRTAKAPTTAPVVQQTMLSPAYPNPFNPATKIAFTLRMAGPVSLAVYTVRGELVAKLVDEYRAAGSHAVEWKGLNVGGQASPSGLYFAQLKADGLVMTQRLTLLR